MNSNGRLRQGQSGRSRRRGNYRYEEDGVPLRKRHKPIDAFATLNIPQNVQPNPTVEYCTPQSYIDVSPAIVRLCKGGFAALVAAKIQYWTDPARDGYSRSRPQANLKDPAWMMSGIGDVVQQLGLDGLPNNAGRKRVERAIDGLVRKQFVERIDGESLNQFSTCWKFGLKLTDNLQANLHKRANQLQQKHFVRVYPAYLDELKCSANEAICLAYLYYRCADRAMKLRVTINGEKWFAASDRQISDETGLTPDQVRQAIGNRKSSPSERETKGLVPSGLILCKTARFRGHPTHHFRVSPAAKETIAKIQTAK